MQGPYGTVSDSRMGYPCTMEWGEDLTVFLWPPRLMRDKGIWTIACLPKHLPVREALGRTPSAAKIHVSQGHQYLSHLLPPQLSKHSSPSQRRPKVGDESGKAHRSSQPCSSNPCFSTLETAASMVEYHSSVLFALLWLYILISVGRIGVNLWPGERLK